MSPADRNGVIVVGSINMDLVVTTSHIPAPGETVLGRTFSTQHGGKGANQAVAAAHGGAQVTLVARLGPDAFGDQLRQGLVDEGIDVTHVGTCKHDPSGVALISVADDGENAIVVAPGANAMVRKVHIDDAVHAGVFDRCAVLLVQLEIPVDVVAHAAKCAHEAGVLVIINPAPVTDLPDSLWPHIDIIVANETEIQQLGGLDTVKAKVPTVVTTLGGDGIAVHHNGTSSSIPALDVDVVDTTGAGDAFCGYLAAELSNGLDVVAAAVRANVAAGLSVTKLGARTAPSSTEVDAFLA
jgi:ribokinase